MAAEDHDSSASPEEVVHALQALVESIRTGAPPDDPAVLVDALVRVRELREVLAAWEPALIAAARAAGVSWALLAPALGVTSRQAAERRYLRTQPTGDLESTKEARVEATRDRRAGRRAVTAWARENSAELRKLAGEVSGLADLSSAGRRDADRLHAELGGEDPATLLDPLSAMRAHLDAEHPDLAARITKMAADADQQRDDTIDTRRSTRGEN
jgi:hypothetical protein